MLAVSPVSWQMVDTPGSWQEVMAVSPVSWQMMVDTPGSWQEATTQAVPGSCREAWQVESISVPYSPQDKVSHVPRPDVDVV